MIADITITAGQLGIGVGVLMTIGAAIVLFRKVFNFASQEEVDKLKTELEAIRQSIRVLNFASKEDLQKLELSIKDELDKHSKMRHDMRKEIAGVTAVGIRVETLLGQLLSQNKNAA